MNDDIAYSDTPWKFTFFFSQTAPFITILSPRDRFVALLNAFILGFKVGLLQEFLGLFPAHTIV